MKEIKAYVRVAVVSDVVTALIREGYCCMTIIDVSGLGNFADPDHARYSIEVFRNMSKMAKMELVCAAETADRVVEIIRENGVTNNPGDGIIFVSPVERAVKIRTGAEGTSILQV